MNKQMTVNVKGELYRKTLVKLDKHPSYYCCELCDLYNRHNNQMGCSNEMYRSSASQPLGCGLTGSTKGEEAYVWKRDSLYTDLLKVKELTDEEDN